MRIRLLERYGAYLSGRGLGAEVRELVKDEVTKKEKVLLDFQGVKVITLGFADELFQGFSEFVEVAHACPDVVACMRYVLLSRKGRERRDE